MTLEERKFLPCILPEKGDRALIDALLGISYIHSRGTNIIGVNILAREIYRQMPYCVKNRTLYSDDRGNPCQDIRRMMKNYLDPFVLLLRDKNAKLLSAFFMPEGYPKNPYIRFLEL